MGQTEPCWDLPQDGKLLVELLIPFYSQLWVSRECESHSCAARGLCSETWRMCTVSTHHEFDLSVVSFALLLTIVQKQMSLALLTLAAGDLWQSGTPCQQWELFVFGSFQEMPPRATTTNTWRVLEACVQGVPSWAASTGRHTFHRNPVLSLCLMSYCGHLTSPGLAGACHAED